MPLPFCQLEREVTGKATVQPAGVSPWTGIGNKVAMKLIKTHIGLDSLERHYLILDLCYCVNKPPVELTLLA
ncbi:unnamed protein product [Caretta caretta]